VKQSVFVYSDPNKTHKYSCVGRT